MKKLLATIVIFLITIPYSIASNPPVVDGTYRSHTTYQFDFNTEDWVVLDSAPEEVQIVLNENYIRIGQNHYTTGEKVKVKTLKLPICC